jgi:AcrR family transcriptional regulator
VFVYSRRVTIPAPPWQKQSRPRPVKPPLGRDAIVTAALTVLDAEGLDGLSMRRVAQELNTGPASLYAHVSNRDELEELVYDRILGEVPLPAAPDPDRWQEQLKQLMRDTFTGLRQHPGAARLGMGRIPFTPNALVIEEATLGLMRAGGLPERTVALGIDLIFQYVVAAAFEEDISAKDWADPVQARERQAQMRGYLESLPADRFPNLVAMAGPLISYDGTDRFEFGLEVLVNGLRANP